MPVKTRLGSVRFQHPRSSRRRTLDAGLIVAAIVLETAGYGKPGSNWGATLFVAGLACEFGFWIRIDVAKKARRHEISSTQK
jgi:hypothetical protein